mgnify:CR=1 FL=1
MYARCNEQQLALLADQPKAALVELLLAQQRLCLVLAGCVVVLVAPAEGDAALEEVVFVHEEVDRDFDAEVVVVVVDTVVQHYC